MNVRQLAILLVLTAKSFIVNGQDVHKLSDRFLVSDTIDLNCLKQSLKGVEVVGLGEQTHNAGTTFLAKTKVLKYLHDSLGFNILVFEAGFFDCYTADKLMQAKAPDNDLFNSIFGIWRCLELKGTMDYIQQCQSPIPRLMYAGMDVQLLGNARKHFIPDFTRFLDSFNKLYVNDIVVDTPFVHSIAYEISYSNYGRLGREDTARLSLGFSHILGRIEEVRADTIQYFSLWKQIVRNCVVEYRRYYYKSLMLRDSMMAENIKWLKKWYPRDKIVIWAASSHLARNTFAVADKNYHFNFAGNYLARHFGSKYYFLAFTCNRGQEGRKGSIFAFKFDKASPGSIEHYISSKGELDFGFLSLRDWKTKTGSGQYVITKSKVFFRHEIKMDIFQVCDGIFYIKEMRPKTRLIL